MTTSGLPQHRETLRPCCPACDSLNVRIYQHGTGRCVLCGATFAKANLRKALTHRRTKAQLIPEKPKKPGSGVFPEPVRERKFEPLRYDMMAHARMCMAGRRG